MIIIVLTFNFIFAPPTISPHETTPRAERPKLDNWGGYVPNRFESSLTPRAMSLNSFFVIPLFHLSRLSGPLLITSNILPLVRSSLLPVRDGLRPRTPPLCDNKECTKHAVLD